ncbi:MULTISPECIES: pentapeptide repeat-containing protein [Winogradskyella]|uniref:pentapeptide repeat-containing protein n=1 Tax=Winogradskyella TaxID=286104 RepID=UPI0015C96C98|nr:MULTISPECIES: pentapeptide repeat-containing protein [Winogradskyella]QXP78859.1 pentapeptide repeat-containing protein [Winogradskyella sp. HaHa_3_26]
MSRTNRKIILYISIIIIVILIIIFRQELLLNIENFAFWAYPNDENRNGEITKLIINIIGGFVVLIGLRAALIRAKASQKGIEKQSESIKNQTSQIELTRISQTNELFKNAIEHLGSKSESIVLGGISELHFIASENKEKFSEVVLNILCSKLRSEASIKKDAEEISKTITQTIIDYIYKTKVYTNLDSDISSTNLTGIKLNNTKIKNCNLSFSNIPWKMHNIEFENCNLTSIKCSLGKFKDIKIINCNIFHSKFNASEFENLEITNSNGIQKLECLNSKFTNSILNCSLYNSTFISCEFISTDFSENDISSINFTASSFFKIDFSKNEITNCNFSACGFVEVITNNWIQKCTFKGIKNDTRYYMLFNEKQLEQSLNTENNFSGIQYNNNLFLKNETSILTKEDADDSIKTYNELVKKHYPKKKKAL